MEKKTEKQMWSRRKGFRSFRCSCFMHEPILKYDHEFWGRDLCCFHVPRISTVGSEILFSDFSRRKKWVRGECGWKVFPTGKKFVVFRSVFYCGNREKYLREKSLDLHARKSFFEEFLLSLRIQPESSKTLPLHFEKG